MKFSNILPIYIKKLLNNNNKQFSESYKFNVGVVKIPHYSKKDKGGEDALAITEQLICVADGVGGWNEQGVDPAKYSRELCENIVKEYNKNFNKFFSTPKKIFVDAANKTTSIGSSTFCMCSLDKEKKYLHTVNLGDSGYMIVRDNGNEGTLNNINSLELLYKSPEQTHQFNFPYQCGTYGDDPESAVTNIHEYKENDIIVLATDGLWDNLYENQIISIIRPFLLTKPIDLNIIAKMIGETCLKYSMDRKYISPFARRSGGRYIGGKDDDITIIVAQIIKNI